MSELRLITSPTIYLVGSQEVNFHELETFLADNGSPDSIPVRLLPIADNGRRRPLKAPDEATRLARVKAWAAFDDLWKTGTSPESLTRNEALAWVGRAMGLEGGGWSIERFSEEECRRLMAILGPEITSQ